MGIPKHQLQVEWAFKRLGTVGLYWKPPPEMRAAKVEQQMAIRQATELVMWHEKGVWHLGNGLTSICCGARIAEGAVRATAREVDRGRRSRRIRPPLQRQAPGTQPEVPPPAFVRAASWNCCHAAPSELGAWTRELQASTEADVLLL